MAVFREKSVQAVVYAGLVRACERSPACRGLLPGATGAGVGNSGGRWAGLCTQRPDAGMPFTLVEGERSDRLFRVVGALDAVQLGMTDLAGWACLFPGVARARASFPFNSF